jgi:hypothetical protein
MIKPTGNTMADIVRIRPGAFVWNQGEAFVDNESAQPKEMRVPPMKEFTNILSSRVCAFLAPMRETSSVVCAGVNASMISESDLTRASNRVLRRACRWGLKQSNQDQSRSKSSKSRRESNPVLRIQYIYVVLLPRGTIPPGTNITSPL